MNGAYTLYTGLALCLMSCASEPAPPAPLSPDRNLGVPSEGCYWLEQRGRAWHFEVRKLALPAERAQSSGTMRISNGDHGEPWREEQPVTLAPIVSVDVHPPKPYRYYEVLLTIETLRGSRSTLLKERCAP